MGIYTGFFVKNIKAISMAYTQDHEEENTVNRPLALLMAVFLAGTVQAGAMAAPVQPKPVPVLMYHNITERGGKGDALNVPAEVFEDHVRHLWCYGFSTITLEQLHDYLNGDDSLPANPLVITFDDGYISNYNLAMEPLKEYGFSAVVFMIGDRVGDDGYLDRDMLHSMQSSGVFDIQNHSLSHLYNLCMADKTTINTEVAQAGEQLNQILDKQVKFFCYPYGRYSQRLKQVLMDNGYLLAFTTQYGVVRQSDDPLELDRLRVFGFDTGASLINRIGRAAGADYRVIGSRESAKILYDTEELHLGQGYGLDRSAPGKRPVVAVSGCGLNIVGIRYQALIMEPIFYAITIGFYNKKGFAAK